MFNKFKIDAFMSIKTENLMKRGDTHTRKILDNIETQ